MGVSILALRPEFKSALDGKEAIRMENLIFRCPHCGDTLLLSDLVGMERLARAISWFEQAEIFEEWAESIREYKMNCASS